MNTFTRNDDIAREENHNYLLKIDTLKIYLKIYLKIFILSIKRNR
jgi:hypothetical protein